MPFDPPDTQRDIHGDDGSQKETLEAGWNVSQVEPAEVNLSIMTSTKERCVEEVLLDGAECQIGHLEVCLSIIVQASQSPDIADGLNDNTVKEEANDYGSKGCEGVSCESVVVDGGRGLLCW